MGKSLYDSEFIYKKEIDNCAEILNSYMERDIREILFPDPDDQETADISLRDTRWTQPAIFITCYALSRLLISWGVRPSEMIGHSIGEYVCACLAGVFSLEDALYLVSKRGSIMKSMPSGSMLSVRAKIADIQNYVRNNVSIAAINSPLLCVLSGPDTEIDKVETDLTDKGIICRKLHTSHAFHSVMMEPVVEPFCQIVKKIPLSKPNIPFVSTVTGTWITEYQAVNPEYWARHLRETVNFSDGISTILKNGNNILVECGPRATSASMARQQLKDNKNYVIVSCMGESGNNTEEIPSLLTTLGNLWLGGVSVDWDAFYAFEQRKRIPLPTYSFEKKRYWLDPPDIKTEYIKQPEKGLETSFNIEQYPKPEKNVTNDKNTDALKMKLIKILEDICGFSLEQFNDNTTFFEMGMDSLFLTQVSYKIREEFNISISFRQLLDNYSTLHSLCGFILSNRQIKQIYDFNKPPVSGARLGKDPAGNPAWFINDPDRPGKYLKIDI
jgi:acyl transferase domain-containing protein